MNSNGKSRIPEILKKYEVDILSDWIEQQRASIRLRGNPNRDRDLHELSHKFLSLVCDTAQRSKDLTDIMASEWTEVRDLLSVVSKSQARQGYSPSETAMFILSLKGPLFSRLNKEFGNDSTALASETWTGTVMLDRLGLFTTESYQKGREEVIARQQQELFELSTPVIKLWEGILALPLIGTLDSARTQVVMENLLQRIVETGSSIAIIDITGVPTVDTLVAQHLLKTAAAARLMGADCIISGIRPQIAQTIVHLGVVLSDVTTKATLADALALAFQRLGVSVSRSKERS